MVEQLHVKVAGDAVEETVYARQLQGPRREVLELRSFDVLIEWGEPSSLARGVLGVGRDQVVGGHPRPELLLDALVEIRMRGRHGHLDAYPLALLELADALVQRVVHRAAHQQDPQVLRHAAPVVALASPVQCSDRERWGQRLAAYLAIGECYSAAAWLVQNYGFESKRGKYWRRSGS
jgi:hypothetical protein